MLESLKPKKGEKIELDFKDVLSVGPSWLDEVLTALRGKFGREKVFCLAAGNASVVESLKVIDEMNGETKS